MGENESKGGLPFVGRSGQILDDALSKSGVTRNDIFVTNVVKCRPPENRKPFQEEEFACSIFLHREIKIVNPVAVMSLGNHALRSTTGLWGITSYVGVWKAVPRPGMDALLVLPNFHPAYIARNYGSKSYFDEIVEEFVKTWRYGLNHSFDETWAYAVP